MTQRTCRELGGFEPDIRHRTNDATVSRGAGRARAGADDAARARAARPRPGVALRAIAEGPVSRTIFAATRAADAARPSTQALLAAIREARAAAAARTADHARAAGIRPG